MGSRRSIVGGIGVAVFIIALICTVIAFSSSSWLVADQRYTGASFERLGLWTHCFESIQDYSDDYKRRFYVGCQWIFDPFTYGYDKIKGFLMPPLIVITQFFYSLTFALVLLSFLFVLLYFLCFGPENKHFVKLVAAIAVSMLAAGICSIVAVSVFAYWASKDDRMFGNEHNYYFGWSFFIAIVGAVASLIAGTLFFIETSIQRKKRNHIKDSRLRLEESQHS